ncbi:MAG: hypothetical protein MUE92_05190 [Chloroflexi bacterium]|nr:hypothetical protein [Chloroflexota bacterium]
MEQAGGGEDRAPAVEVDRVVLRQQPDGALRDPGLLERRGGGLGLEMRLVEALVDGDGAAVNPPQPAGGGERVEVAAHGRLGDAEGGAQLLEADDPPRIDDRPESLASCGGEVLGVGRAVMVAHSLIRHAQILSHAIRPFGTGSGGGRPTRACPSAPRVGWGMAPSSR